MVRIQTRIIFIFMGLCMAVSALSAKKARPNIVLIMADDLGYSDVGCFGGEIQTPNLDRLAENGIRITEFYNTAKCHTTRASLMTGLYWQQAMRGDKYLLGGNGVTIAEVLGAGGYRTAIAGKWHLSNSGDSEQAPLERGFDRFFGTISGAGSFYNPRSLQRDRTPVEPEKDFYYTDAITEEAVQNIRQAATDEKPLFLYVSYTAPHWPLQALPEDIAKYSGNYNEGWDAIREARYSRMLDLGIIPKAWKMSMRDSNEDWHTLAHRDWHERRMEVYAAMVDRMDQGVGRIVDALRETDQFNNSFLMFLSDNGGCSVDVAGELAANCLGNNLNTRDGLPITTGPVPGVMPGPETTFQAYGAIWANVSNTPYRKYKSSSFEGGIRTPFIMHWPDRIVQPGRIVRKVAHLIDILPTCLEVAGADYPGNFKGKPLPPPEGVSLSRILNGEPWPSRTIYQQFNKGAALRHGIWKIVTSHYENGPWQIFDMRADGTEIHDLSTDLPEQKATLIAMWQQWANRVNVRK